MKHTDQIRKRDHVIRFLTASVACVVLTGAIVSKVLKMIPEEREL